MATQTKSVSGTTVTYVITDVESNTVTVTAQTTSAGGVAPYKGITVSTSAGVLADAAAMLVNLLLLLYTGLQP